MSADNARLSRTLAPAAIAVSAVCFGFLGLFARWFEARRVLVLHMLSVRFLGGAACLMTLTVLSKQWRRFDRASLIQVTLLGVLYVAEAWCYFTSAKYIPVGLTALLLYLYPAMVTLYEWVWLKRPPGLAGGLALALALGGVSLCVTTPAGELHPLGLILGIATALVYTLYIVIGGQMSSAVGSLQKSAALMTLSGVLFATAAAFQSPWLPQMAQASLTEVVLLVLVGTVIPIPLLLFGLSKVSAARASIISTLEPVTALMVSALLLSESLSNGQLVGASMIVAAVVVSALRSTK